MRFWKWYRPDLIAPRRFGLVNALASAYACCSGAGIASCSSASCPTRSFTSCSWPPASGQSATALPRMRGGQCGIMSCCACCTPAACGSRKSPASPGRDLRERGAASQVTVYGKGKTRSCPPRCGRSSCDSPRRRAIRGRQPGLSLTRRRRLPDADAVSRAPRLLDGPADVDPLRLFPAGRRSGSRHLHQVPRIRIGLTGNSVPIGIEPVRVTRVSTQHRLCVRLSFEV
jgi:hypothetical protein